MSYMCVVLCWNYCSFYQCVGPFSKPYTWWQESRRISTCCLQKTPVVSNFALIPKSSHPFCVFNVHWAVPSVPIFVFEQQRPGRWWLLALASASRVFLQDEMIAAHCTVDRFTKFFFWNFQKTRAVLCYILIDKQMLDMAFCSNIAPSLSSGNHLFYKAEYMGQSCPNQVWAITFDWSALATWNKHFWTAFW